MFHNGKNVGFSIQKDVKSNFTKIPNQVFALKLDPYTKLVLCYLYSNSDDFVHYNSFIGKKIGISRQTVSRCLNDLVSIGILDLITPHQYRLIIPDRVNQINTVDNNDVNLATHGVNLPTQPVAKLTRGVNQINTNKNTPIIRSNNKSNHDVNQINTVGNNPINEVNNPMKDNSWFKQPIKEELNSNHNKQMENTHNINQVEPTKVEGDKLPTGKERHKHQIKTVEDFFKYLNEKEVQELLKLSLPQFNKLTNPIILDEKIQASIWSKLRIIENTYQPAVEKKVSPIMIVDEVQQRNDNQVVIDTYEMFDNNDSYYR